jgi:citrate (Re)-synthase
VPKLNPDSHLWEIDFSAEGDLDIKEPDLMRDQFPYSETPRTVFDNRDLPLACPEDIFITDTTFRDGQQARPPYTVQQVVDLFTFMHRLGGPKGLVRQSEFFLYADRDREAVERCRALGFEFPEITGWIRAVKKDFELVKQMELKETGILTSASDYHIFLKLRMTRRQAMDQYLGVAKTALDSGIIPRCHFEDVTRADFYGFVVPFAQKLMDLADEYKMPVKVRLCDTLGYGVPYPGAALPRGVAALVHGLRTEAGVPAAQLEWHGHNDFHKVLANAATAWLYGCAAANCTLLGMGERTGNPPLEGAVFEYLSLRGHEGGVDTRVITEIADYYSDEIGVDIPTNYPFVGRDFNVTRAGVHADGLLKNEEIYNIFDTRRLLKRPLAVAITDKSGLAGILHWVESHMETPNDGQLTKNHPGIVAIKDWIDVQYADQRTTSISDDEMLVQTREHLAPFFPST